MEAADPSVGIGLDMNTDLLVVHRKLNRSLKSAFVSSDWSRAVSLHSAWTIILVTVDARERKSYGSLFKMMGTVEPGRQRVTVLVKQTCLMMKSPIMKAVGGRRGQGGDR